MIRKKGCDCMFKKLVMLVCFGILLGFNIVSAQANDELPPLVIETDDIRYAGAEVDWNKKWVLQPSIIIPDYADGENGMIFYKDKDTPVYEKPQQNSSIIGYVEPVKYFPIVESKAYIYPRMGKTMITSSIPMMNEENLSDENIPKVNDIIYVVYYPGYENYNAIAWYKGKFIGIPAKGIKMPFVQKNIGNIYAVYQGYVFPQDRDKDIDYMVGMTYLDNERHYIMAPKHVWGISNYRRNADIWFKIKLNNNQEGWIQVADAHTSIREQLRWALESDLENRNFGFVMNYNFND